MTSEEARKAEPLETSIRMAYKDKIQDGMYSLSVRIGPVQCENGVGCAENPNTRKVNGADVDDDFHEIDASVPVREPFADEDEDQFDDYLRGFDLGTARNLAKEQASCKYCGKKASTFLKVVRLSDEEKAVRKQERSKTKVVETVSGMTDDQLQELQATIQAQLDANK